MIWSRPLKIGIVGLGKIAVDQHIPAILSNKKLRLVAGCTKGPAPTGIKTYGSVEEMLQKQQDIQAVAICTPPKVRLSVASTVIEAGKHCFLEKPPASTLGEAEAIAELAVNKGVTLFSSWHSRYAPGVELARQWITERSIASRQH